MQSKSNGKLVIFRMLSALLLIVLHTLAAAQAPSPDSLYRGFQNPPKEDDLFPLWTWNGDIEAGEAKRQIDLMQQQGIRRAIVYPFPNLRVRPFSEQWWSLWGQILSYAREKGFQLGIEPEIESPDGVARDKWLLPPDQSLVLEGHPEYRMKRLVYVQREFTGPGNAKFSSLPRPTLALAAPVTSSKEIDGDRIIDVTNGLSDTKFSADLPEGDWKLMFFYVEDTVGSSQYLRVDAINPDAIARFIDLTLGEYYRRFKEYFGKTITFVLIDNEGEYGNAIAWTPGLFDKFKAAYGYDLRTSLPLLVYEGGNRTPKVRNDYLNLISDLYAKNYWGQMARWAEAHQLELTGQSYTEALQYDAAYGGNLFPVQRALTIPGTEALGNRGRSPRENKELESIAHFDGKRYWCENELVLGSTSYISPQKMRYGTNTLGLWGINLWSPQLYYDPNALVWPPDWFISEPWWKYFRTYTDYVQRISYMNDGGRHVADILLYRPIEDVFAYSDPIFQVDKEHAVPSSSTATPPPPPESTLATPSSTSMISDSGREEDGLFSNAYYPLTLWRSNFASEEENAYTDLTEMLVGQQRDFDVVDSSYLSQSTLGQGALHLGAETFRTVVLPPMTIISRSAIAKLRKFYESGGNVIAVRTLPSGSPEGGWNDPAVRSEITAIFGTVSNTDRNTENRNALGGTALFVAGPEKVMGALDQVSHPDFKVEEGETDRILYSHRLKDGSDIYWVVNDSDQARDVVVSVAVEGQPEIWDPETGEKHPTPYWVKSNRTYLPLKFNPWDATYVVLGKTDVKAPSVSISATNFNEYAIENAANGGAVVRGTLPADADRVFVEGKIGEHDFRVSAPRAKPVQTQVLPDDGWTFRLNPSQVSIRYARTTSVPSGEGESAGFIRAHYNDQLWQLAPLSGEQFSIRNWWVIGPFPNQDKTGFNIAYPPEETFDVDATYEGALGERIAWRKYHSQENEVDLFRALGTRAKGVAYARTWVYSPTEEHARAVLLGQNTKMWVNRKQVFALYSNATYYELRDPFSFDPEVQLSAGWNEILVKVATGDYGPGLVFSLRFDSKSGEPLTALSENWESQKRSGTELDEDDGHQQGDEHWYRVEAPIGAQVLNLDHPDRVAAVFADGKRLEVDQHVRIPQPELQREPRMISLKMLPHEVLTAPLRFETGETKYWLGSWNRTGLTYFSGTATYEREFLLHEDLLDKQVFIDLGRVGVVAEIWMNGQHVSDRLWAPFRADVTKYLKPGKNALRILVTNSSDAAQLAVPDFSQYMHLKEIEDYYAPPYLDRIDLNGFIGPVQLIPYDHAEVAVNP